MPFNIKTSGQKTTLTSNGTLTRAPRLRKDPGGDNNMRVVIEKVNTENVRCYGKMLAPNLQNSCQGLLNTMPVDDTERIFGPRSDPLVDVALPHLLLSSE